MNTELETGLRVRYLLDESASQLPAPVQARLAQAVALSVQHAQNKESQRKAQSGLSGWWQKVSADLLQPSASFAVSFCFVVAAAAGVVVEMQSTQEEAMIEMVDLDAAILADDLPTDAWLDNGFVSYSTDLERNAWQNRQQLNNWLEQLEQQQPNT